MKQLQETHSKEMNDLMQTWVKELGLLGNRLMEKAKASSVLSCELKEMKGQTDLHESKLKSQVTEEISRMEQIIHLEKVSDLSGFLTVHM